MPTCYGKSLAIICKLCKVKGLKEIVNLFKFRSHFRSYSSNTQYTLIWNMIFCLGLGIHLVLYNLFLQSMVSSELVIGKILGLNFIAQAIIYIPAGFLSDRLGSKKGVIAGVCVFTFALTGNLFATTPSELAFWGFLIGVGHAASIVTFVPLLTEYSNAIEKKELFTFAFSTGTFFTFLGTLLGGIVSDGIQELFHLSNSSSIRITLSITIIMFILCLIPLLFVRETESQLIANKAHSTLLSILKKKPKLLVPIMTFSISKALAGASLGIIAPFINLFFLHKFALSPSNISFILAIATLGTVVFMSYNSSVTSRITEVQTVSLYHLLSIPAVLLLGATQNIWVAAVAFILFRSTKFGLNPIETKIMMDRVEPEVRGLTNSFGFMATSISISLLGPIAMYIVQVAGNEQGYLILCILSALGSFAAAIYFLLVFGNRKMHETNVLKSNTV